MNTRIIIAGGGTGGHIFPAVATANALQRLQPDIDILFVGAKGKMEMEKVPQAGYKIIGLDIAGFNRSNLVKNIFLPFKLLKSFMQARKVIKDFKPHACLGVGGYASFPILRMAQRMNIPTAIQEQNSFAGKSNKILGQKAKVICTAYDHMEKFFPSNAIVKTGNPVRKTIQEMKVAKEDALPFFGLQTEKKTLFVFGGSLGALSINKALLKNLSNLVAMDIQIIWQTGKNFFQEAKEATAPYAQQIKVYDFLKEMELAYAAADIIVSRAGALSIAELCIAGKAVVFVPYPFASEDHQTHNAMALVHQQAALLIKDNEVADLLGTTLADLLTNEAKCNSLAQHIKALAVYEADDKIAQKLLEIAV